MSQMLRPLAGFDEWLRRRSGGAITHCGGLIPPSLSSDPCEPRIPAEGLEALWGECVPCFAAGVDDGAVAVEQPMREEAFAQVEPDTLDRIWGTAPNAPGCRAAAERG